MTHQVSWLESTGALIRENQLHGVEQKSLTFLAGFDGKNWNHFYGRRHAKVKQRVRKGIPDAVRGLAWQMLSGSRELVQLNPGALFMHLLCLFIRSHHTHKHLRCLLICTHHILKHLLCLLICTHHILMHLLRLLIVGSSVNI